MHYRLTHTAEEQDEEKEDLLNLDKLTAGIL